MSEGSEVSYVVKIISEKSPEYLKRKVNNFHNKTSLCYIDF